MPRTGQGITERTRDMYARDSKANRLDTMRGHYERNLAALGLMGDEMSRMMREASDWPNDETLAMGAMVDQLHRDRSEGSE
jgi:hypothetical protein